MKTRLFLAFLSASIFALTACDDDPEPSDGDGDTASDAGEDGGEDAAVDTANDTSGDTTEDAAGDTTADLGDTGEGDAADVSIDTPDVAESDCVAVEILPTWTLAVADDVSVGFNVPIDTEIDDTYHTLTLLFERYVPGPDIGAFDLSQAPDNNFGTCAHCVVLWEFGNEAYVADRGILTTNLDPYLRRFDASMTNLRLVQATLDPETRQSTPVEGGGCVEVADFTVSEGFPEEGWTCLRDEFADGEICNCECGATDTDCYYEICAPEDPECESNPLPTDCAETEVCGFNALNFLSHCVETCDWVGRDGCTEGTCVFDFGVGVGDTCYSDDEFLDEAGLGEDCVSNGYQRLCNLVDGFAEGFCDYDGVCQPICDSEDDCTEEGEECWQFFGEEGLGWCGPPFSGE